MDVSIQPEYAANLNTVNSGVTAVSRALFIPVSKYISPKSIKFCGLIVTIIGTILSLIFANSWLIVLWIRCRYLWSRSGSPLCVHLSYDRNDNTHHVYHGHFYIVYGGRRTAGHPISDGAPND